MEVHWIRGKGLDSNIYLIKGDEATLIDAGTGLYHSYVMHEIKKHVNPKDIKKIILTHEHADHYGGVPKILEEIGNVEVASHRSAAEKLRKGSDITSLFFGFPSFPLDVSLELADGDRIRAGDDELLVIHTPGHSPGSICLYNEEEKILFSGDTVFQYGSFGRFDLPGGDVNALLDSIEKLLSMDVDIIYPGHGEVVLEDGKDHILLAMDNLKAALE